MPLGKIECGVGGGTRELSGDCFKLALVHQVAGDAACTVGTSRALFQLYVRL